jgi:hypothetical protein
MGEGRRTGRRRSTSSSSSRGYVPIYWPGEPVRTDADPLDLEVNTPPGRKSTSPRRRSRTPFTRETRARPHAARRAEPPNGCRSWLFRRSRTAVALRVRACWDLAPLRSAQFRHRRAPYYRIIAAGQK